MKKKILVTGAAGYIGSMLCEEFVRKGFEVSAVDILSYSKSSLNHLFFFKNFSFFNYDITKKNNLKKLIKNVDFIIPLAALVGAPLCEKFKKKATQINFNQIKDILELRKKKQKIIYLNSNSGYGIGKKNKYCDEKSLLNPISHYGKTKVDAEKKLIKDINKNFISFRLATVFGYSYRMRTDLIVNYYVKESINRSRIDVYEPKFRRNFIHVRDVVRAIMFSVKNFNKMKNNVYNLGLSNANITKLQLAKKVKKINPKTKIIILKNRNDPDQRDYFVSNKKIEKIGFKPKVSLETGILETFNCLKNDQDYKNNY